MTSINAHAMQEKARAENVKKKGNEGVIDS
jgi:hypothetical protein